jgi:hypothetical protein
VAHIILEGYPGYRLELPDNESPQTTEWFVSRLLKLAKERNDAAMKKRDEALREAARRQSREDSRT